MEEKQKALQQTETTPWSVGTIVWFVFRIPAAWVNVVLGGLFISEMLTDRFPGLFKATNCPPRVNLGPALMVLEIIAYVAVTSLYLILLLRRSEKALRGIVALTLLWAVICAVYVASAFSRRWRCLGLGAVVMLLTAITVLLARKKLGLEKKP